MNLTAKQIRKVALKLWAIGSRKKKAPVGVRRAGTRGHGAKRENKAGNLNSRIEANGNQ